jgi:3-hexulose-6-phosphate synthase
MTTLLQLALDTPAALGVLPRVAPWVDIIEVGTPLLKRLGLSAIPTVREAAPGALVLADSKTVDGGAQESAMLFDAGADIVTVLSCAPEATFEVVGRAAVEGGKAALIDTLTEPDPAAVAGRPYPDGFEYLALHTSTDARLAGHRHSTDSFATAVALTRRLKLVLAGGIDRDTLEAAAALDPAVIVVGRAITTAADPEAVAEWMHGVLS